MNDAEAPVIGDVIEEAEPELVHWYPPRHQLPHATASKIEGALLLGAAAFGAMALGALAIGALAIGRLAVGRARFKDLEIDQLTVRKLRILEPQVRSSTASTTGTACESRPPMRIGSTRKAKPVVEAVLERT